MSFHFTLLPSKDFPSFTAKSQRELFEKWGMYYNMNLDVYSYDKYFDIQHKENFVDFFCKECIMKSPAFSETIISSIEYKVNCIPASVTSMSFFDRLFTSSVVRKCGSITKCYDTMINDVLVSDELRKMVISDEDDTQSKFLDLFSSKEKCEFIYHVFRHIVIGGYCNQYEDDVQPYIDTTKHVYKDLMTVVKDTQTNKLTVLSYVLSIKIYSKDHNGHSVKVFPGKKYHVQNFCYLIIDPEKRQLIVWKHLWN